MKKWLIRILGSLVFLAVIAVAFVWLLFASPFFSEMRRDIVATFLSDQIGQPLQINDDVSVALGRTSQIYAGGVVIPSQTMPDTALAELNLLEFELDVARLLQGELHFDNLVVDGLRVNMVTQPDGTTSWSAAGDDGTADTPADQTSTQSEAEPDASSDATDETGRNSIVEFLSDKNVSFTSIGLLVDDQLTGFAFDFDLASLALEQVDGGQRTTVSGEGSVNGQDFNIQGDYPNGAPFTTHADFGGLSVDFNGEPFSEEEGGGYWGAAVLDTGSIGDLLEVLGLERSLEGRGQMEAKLVVKEALKAETFVANVQLDDGQEINVEGSVVDLLKASGLDIKLDARLHPEGQPPGVAKSVEELKLSGVEMHLVGKNGALEFDKLLFMTNAFDQGLEIIGPVTIEKIQRSPDGTLAMLGIGMLAGPEEDPVLRAEGEVLDMLQLQGVTLDGTLKGAARLLLPDLDPEVVDDFGGIEADFGLSNADGPLSLTKFDVTSYDTEIWALDLSLAVKELKGLGGLDFDIDLDILDGAQFLSALKLEPVDVGALGVAATTTREGDDFNASVDFKAGSSNLSAALDAAFPEGAPVVRGEIVSERLDVNDLKNLAASMVQLQGLVDRAGGKGDPEVQPLVLPKDTDEPEVQPLVLPKEKGKPTDLLNVEKLLAEADVEVSIDFKEITGQKGVSAVSSELTAKEGKVAFGPLNAAYGGGQFSLSAAMDIIEAPETLALSGSTGGWDFGEILDAVGLGIEAYGVLSGDFNVSGNISSLDSFINSMRGSANVSMSAGAISTSLLELAGLGIFPWLFSEELRQGYTDITCVEAPVRIDAGKVGSDSIVVETGSVQLVVKGQVDWINDAIAIRAEPRRVGKPLARSAWPFDVTGKLSAPEFKLDIGGSRSTRADGADDMPAQRQPCVPDIQQLQ